MKTPIHLRYDCYRSTRGHPQKVMKKLGITYQDATPQSMGDQWWFWNCENVPDRLPEYLEPLGLDPMDCIGFGLSKEDAERIRDKNPHEEVVIKSQEERIATLIADLKKANLWDRIDSMTVEGIDIKINGKEKNIKQEVK